MATWMAADPQTPAPGTPEHPSQVRDEAGASSRGKKVHLFLGTFKGSGLEPGGKDVAERVTLVFGGDGVWKMTTTSYITEPPEVNTDTGQWILRDNRIELWEKGFGDPKGDNNAIVSDVISIKGHWRLVAVDVKGGFIDLSKTP